MSNTVTSQLRKSIVKVTGKIMQQIVYSDTRKKGLAVGVKICYTKYPQSVIDEVIKDMESKGYKHAYTRYNSSNNLQTYWHTVPGQRFCFYNK